jgi:hypothetical protein
VPCSCRPWSSSHDFLFCQGQRAKKALHRSLAKAPAALMWPLVIVFGDPSIKVGLQLVDRPIDLLAERDPVELVQDSAVEALADTIGLRALGLGAGVIDVLDGEISSYSWLSLPQNSVPRSVSTRDSRMPCSS